MGKLYYLTLNNLGVLQNKASIDQNL